MVTKKVYRKKSCGKEELHSIQSQQQLKVVSHLVLGRVQSLMKYNKHKKQIFLKEILITFLAHEHKRFFGIICFLTHCTVVEGGEETLSHPNRLKKI